MMIDPFDNIPIPPEIASLPKADIHVHAEWTPRLDKVLAARDGREAYDWVTWAKHLMATYPAGEDRLAQISPVFPELVEADKDPDNFIARVVDILDESARDGAILTEIRFGKDFAERPNSLDLMRQAEKQVQENYPDFRMGAIPFIYLTWDQAKLDRIIPQYVDWAEAGLLHGADVFAMPYAEEADWTEAYRIADKLATAGLRMTVHVAEVAPVNITSVLKMPGLTRIGHATHAGYHPQLLEQVAESGVTVECALSCNVILGASDAYETHPIRTFVDAGIPVTLCTDDPVQMSTTIGREYAIAHQLGFTAEQLLAFTQNAIEVAFIAEDDRNHLMRLCKK